MTFSCHENIFVVRSESYLRKSDGGRKNREISDFHLVKTGKKLKYKTAPKVHKLKTRQASN